MEFYGDFWHGNPKLYAKTTINPVTDCTMGDLYEKTMDKQKYLEDRGYTYRCIWENDFDQKCKEDAQLKEFIHESEIVLPLEPRDAFFGAERKPLNFTPRQLLTRKSNITTSLHCIRTLTRLGKYHSGILLLSRKISKTSIDTKDL